jgi:hypothetical protein
MCSQHPKEHLLKTKEKLACVIGPSKKIAFEDKITLLDFQKAQHVIKQPQVSSHKYPIVQPGKDKY